MKLLLTSSGLANSSIAKAFRDLVGKNPNETKIGFVPIAANAEGGNKDWFIGAFVNLWRYGYNWIDIIDPTANDVDWQKRLEEVDVVYISGGNTFHLLNQVKKTGFGEWLKANVDKKVYLGSSAGAILMTPNIGVAGIEQADENLPGLSDLSSLGFVDFEVNVHVPSMVSSQAAEDYAAKSSNEVYIIDDETAVLVNGNKVEVISEGFWKKIAK